LPPNRAALQSTLAAQSSERGIEDVTPGGAASSAVLRQTPIVSGKVEGFALHAIGATGIAHVIGLTDSGAVVARHELMLSGR